ncbi:MAG: hypothetical protein H7Y27_09295, partial [Gemmatimonadaceae bacterium]|nr:hypothetical protein [Chitinophagaceae bacterium]
MVQCGLKCLWVLLLFASSNLFSQDKIYLNASARQGNITDITQTSVSYQSSGAKKEKIEIPLNTIVLLFNDHGNWLIPSELNFTTDKTKEQVKTFLSDNQPAPSADRIFLVDGTVVEGKIVSEDSKVCRISVRDETKNLSKGTIAL